MKAAPIPVDERERLGALRDYDVLDTPSDPAYDDIVELVGELLDVPISLISLVDSERQWFKARRGLGACETGRDVSFCGHAILGDDVFYVPDATKDDRFADNPLVGGEPRVVFYAGAPLITPAGFRIGTLCAIDHRPRALTSQQRGWLRKLAKVTVSNLELDRHIRLARCLAEGRRTLLEDATRRSDELERFASFAAHELSAPLTRIRRWASLAADDAATLGDEHQRRLHKIEEHASRLASMVRDLLAMGIAGGGSTSDDGDCEVTTLLESVVEDASDAARRREVDLRIDVSPGLHVSASALSIRQIADNLVSNAIKYSHPTREGKFAAIKARVNDDTLTVSVSDNGLGIPAESQSRMFEMFERFHRDRAPGTGVGLALVHRHVRSLGGAIDVASTDEGTTITIHLPGGTQERRSSCA